MYFYGKYIEKIDSMDWWYISSRQVCQCQILVYLQGLSERGKHTFSNIPGPRDDFLSYKMERLMQETPLVLMVLAMFHTQER